LLITQDTSTEFLMGAMRAGVREMIPSNGGNEALQAAIARVLRKRSQKNAGSGRQEGKVLTFLSCKGGSGATFIAGNLAYVLAAEQNKRVALIDMNLLFGDAAMSVSDQSPPSDVAELSQQIHRLDASLLQASMLEAAPNFFILAAPEDPARSTDVKREHAEAIVRLAKRHYDFVVIDVPRQLDPVSLLSLDLADMIFPVVQLALPFVRDGKRLLSLFRSLDYPGNKVHMIVNRYEKGSELSLDDLARTTGAKPYRTVPNYYPAATSSVNLGVPVTKMQKTNPISKVLIEMAHSLSPTEQQATSSGWLSRVFS
jgi:pilus assembly protein CpaE